MEENKSLEEAGVRELLLSKSEISLLIRDYNDIFSSFDPRHFGERSLSDDFLMEAKRAARDKKGIYELRFLIPKVHRNFEHEVVIKRRLREHFRRHFHMVHEESSAVKKKGIYMAVAGAVFIFAASGLASIENGSFALHFFETLLEPAGWFTAWTGLDQFFYTANEYKSDLEFYKKMADAEIKFSSY